MARFRQHVFAKVLLSAGGMLLLLVVTNSAISLRSERATFERCRLLHQEVIDKLVDLQKLRRIETPSRDDDAWNDACETLQVVFRMSWGHFPSEIPEDAYQRLSNDLDTLLHAASMRSSLLEQVWVRIGNSSPHLFQHLQQKEELFEASLARLRELEDSETKNGTR